MRRCSRLGVGVILVAASFHPATAFTEVEVDTSRSGLQAVAVSFFTAVPLVSEQTGNVHVRYGDMTLLPWAPGGLEHLDAHVIVANTSRLKLPRVDVRVSVFMGHAALADLPTEDEIRPGSPAILEERLFFERTYTVEDLGIGMLGRVTVPDIQLRWAVADLMRQKMWPAYVRVEASLSEPSGDVEIVLPTISGLLKVLPATRGGGAPGAAEGATSADSEDRPAGSAPPGE